MEAIDVAGSILPPISARYIGPMKTTLDISDPLLREAQKMAARKGTTLRSLVEQGLRQVIADGKRRRAFRLRNASFKGRGLRPELRDAGWDRLRDAAYEGLTR
jgi:hypothetical protein